MVLKIVILLFLLFLKERQPSSILNPTHSKFEYSEAKQKNPMDQTDQT